MEKSSWENRGETLYRGKYERNKRFNVRMFYNCNFMLKGNRFTRSCLGFQEIIG